MNRIHNTNLLLSFSAGNQMIESYVNVPFDSKKMVLHPPRHNLTAANITADQFLLYSSLNKGAGIMGMIDGMQSGIQAEPITVIFDEPVQLVGQFRFWVRSFTDASGGASTTLTARVWQHIEFHSQ